MKKIIFIALAITSNTFAAQPIVIEKPMIVRASEGEQIFPVKEDSVAFHDSIIREMAIGEDITVAYKNTSEEALSPKFTLKIYNNYGFLLGHKEVGGTLFGGVYLQPNELGGDKIYMEWIDYKEAFKHSNFILREDFAKAAWISISKANFELKKEATPAKSK